MWLGEPFYSWSVEVQQKLIPARFQRLIFCQDFAVAFLQPSKSVSGSDEVCMVTIRALRRIVNFASPE